MDQRSVLQERLMSLERGFSSITEYMNSAQSIADAFAAINNPLSEDDLITCILHGLGPAFNKFVVSIQSRLHELTLTDLRVRLLKHEQWLFRASFLHNPFVDPNSPLPFYASQHPYQISIGPEPSSLSNRSQGRNHNTQYHPSQTSKPPTNNQQTPMTTGPSTCQIGEENNQEEKAPVYEPWVADFASSSDSITKAEPYEGGNKVMLGDGVGAGVARVIASLKWRRKINENGHQNLETFLKKLGPLAPKRYKYSDIKTMTNSFQQKLGEGGYGSVFKGKLKDGTLVAVKIPCLSSTNGFTIINEFAMICKTSHVNIVSLLGFCFEKKKKMALIYEFMPNGSLEKFIYIKAQSDHLGWQRLHQISIRIARGLEYLHRDCNTQILHFDIKPSNILLDQDFCPKICDFGLAMPLRQEPILGRGSIGYIAPEVYFTHFGRVSYKSDVYSYGMMLLEMAGGRKNIDPFVNHTSQIYFPHWIDERLERNEDLGLHGVLNEEREELARKMIIVGLWCIQTNPLSRPSMSKVLDMLEGTIKSLQIPPKATTFS